MLRAILEEAGTPEATITTERRGVELESADEWWQAVTGSGLRRHVLLMGPGAAGAVRRRNERWMAEQRVRAVEVGMNYASATRLT